ncbi:MAG: hypothetical protein AABX89_03265 [Candidatus Thermoplasmatota archaeon]
MQPNLHPGKEASNAMREQDLDAFVAKARHLRQRDPEPVLHDL